MFAGCEREPGGKQMAKEIELRRHTDSDGDALTDEGLRAALEWAGSGDLDALRSADPDLVE
jgi:hypothetical protein